MDYSDILGHLGEDDPNTYTDDINALLNETIHSGIANIDDALLPSDETTQNTEIMSLQTDVIEDTQEEAPSVPNAKRTKKSAPAMADPEKENTKIAKEIMRGRKGRSPGGYFDFEQTLSKEFSIHEYVPDYPLEELLPVPFNIICLGKVPFEGELDLKTLYARCKCVEFGSENRPVLHMTITEPRAMTAFIYPNGTVRLVGATSIMMGKNAMKRVMQVIREVFKAKFQEFPFACCNLMANFDYGVPIHISELAQKFPNACFYEPLIFAGVTVYFQDNVRALVFVSGKCAIVGARTHNQLLLAFQALTKRIAPYFKEQSVGKQV